MRPLRLDGQAALVTGASRGLGLGIAKALAAAGAEVWAVAENTEELDQSEHSQPLEELTRQECLALLSVHSVGRIAVIGHDNLPFVVPVNYRMTGDTVLFRTDAGTKLDAVGGS